MGVCADSLVTPGSRRPPLGGRQSWSEARITGVVFCGAGARWSTSRKGGPTGAHLRGCPRRATAARLKPLNRRPIEKRQQAMAAHVAVDPVPPHERPGGDRRGGSLVVRPTRLASRPLFVGSGKRLQRGTRWPLPPTFRLKAVRCAFGRPLRPCDRSPLQPHRSEQPGRRKRRICGVVFPRREAYALLLAQARPIV